MAATSPEAPERPPDTRGGTTPAPLSILAGGVAALIASLGGTFAIQLAYALGGGETVTRECVAEGVQPDLVGALGVCHIIEAFRSRAETVALLIGLVVGLASAISGFAVNGRMPSKRMKEQAIAGAVLGSQAVLLALFLFYFRSGSIFRFVNNFMNIEVLEGSLDGFIRGARNTVLLAFVGEFGGIVIGLTLAVLALSKRRTVRAPASTYINFFRGTPLIWQLSVFYFGLALGLRLNVSAYVTAMIVFALNTGAYAAEVFRAGIQSIERGQMEAARSLGMTYAQSMRYAIIPQAVRRVIPPLMNEFVILIKDTSLITVLGLLATELDLFSFGREGFSSTFNATYFVAVAAGYLVITLPLIRIVNAVEARLHSGLLALHQ
jgi:His/Glu/Gln/Arg/opine family amino acid ABC transporter permease subunit